MPKMVILTTKWGFERSLMKTLIVFATEMEAQETRKRLANCNLCDICVTGMGPSAVMKTLSKQIAYYDRIINAGIVGALHSQLQVGQQVAIQTVSYQQETLFLSREGYRLLTVDKPLYEHIDGYDIVDMEGYQVTSLCQAAQKELHFMKIVSDRVGPDSLQKIRERLPALSHALALLTTSYIAKISDVTNVNTTQVLM